MSKHNRAYQQPMQTRPDVDCDAATPPPTDCQAQPPKQYTREILEKELVTEINRELADGAKYIDMFRHDGTRLCVIFEK